MKLLSLKKRFICKGICIPALVLIANTGFCQVDSLNTDSTYNIESFSDELGIYIYGIQKFSNFELKSTEQKKTILYTPNEKFNLGAGFNYKWLGMGLAFNFGFVNADNDLYGETKSLDLQIDVYKKKFYANGNFQYYKGYYWKNSSKFIPGWNNQNYPVIRPDIATVTLGATGIYVFNHEKFSFKAAFQNTERQLNSAGSWLLGGKFSIYGIASDSSIVPAIIEDFYPDSLQFGGLSTINLGNTFGYTYSLVLKKNYFWNTTLLIGLNLQALSTYDLYGSVIDNDARISSNAMFRMALGCNKPSVFYGISISADSFLIKDSIKTEFTYSYGKVRIYYGRRFSLK